MGYIPYKHNLSYKSAYNSSTLLNKLIADTVSFGSNDRHVQPSYKKNKNGHLNLSSMFRGDLDWFEFAKTLDKHFKNKDKVNIICQACSDGSEPYTLAITLLEELGEKKAKKFFPIIAKDFDSEILKGAPEGMINLTERDIRELENRGIDFNKYFEESGKTLVFKNDKLRGQKTYRVKDILKENVVFAQADILKDLETLEDDSNTVLLFRNALGYLSVEKTIQFLDMVDEKFKPDSILVLGGARRGDYVDKRLMESMNFRPICKKRMGENQIELGTFLKNK